MALIKTFKSRALVEGSGRGRALVLTEPLSLWGGLNPQTGEIIDRRHPQCGKTVTNCALVMRAGKGSSSASSILLEAIRAGTAPAAIILAEADAILALGSAVAREMYSKRLPVVVLRADDYAHLEDDQMIAVSEDGTVTISDD
ncbi:MAG: DUF126 domain-containing protein [Acidobacteriota bacterium]